jgi:hypothetical protein
MTKRIASLALVALAACGGGNEAGAVVEDTTSIPASQAPAASPAPSPADSTVTQGTVGTTGDSATGTAQQ